MNIRLLAFGTIEEIIQQESISLPDHSSVGDLRKLLEASYDRLRNMSYRIAVNQEFQGDHASLTHGCEVALLPPFSGG